MPLKNALFLFFFALIAFPVFAQQITEPTFSNDKNEAKRQRIDRMLKMEEDGDLIFNHYTVFGFRLATDGYGIFYERGKFINNQKSRVIQIEINEKKDPKDHKEAVSGDGYSYNYVSVGRLNNFYQLKASIGEQYLIGGKGNKNGVAVTALYSGGVSLGMLKRYVLNVFPDASAYYTIGSTYPTIFDSSYVVYNTQGLGGGWNQLTFTPGLNAKLAMRFDYGRFNQNITAIEAGVTGEYYINKQPLMYLVPQKTFFFNAYISIMFGHRK
jgi:hypothetical protein